MSKQFKLLLFVFLSLSSIGCDRITKHLAQVHLAGSAPRYYCNEWVRLDYVENTGAAMSLGASWPDEIRFWAFRALPLLIMGLLLVFSVRQARQLHALQISGLALVFSGGTGNLIDRFFNNSRVPDFMVLGVPRFQTGVFNVADVCITVGVLILLIFHLFTVKKTIF